MSWFTRRSKIIEQPTVIKAEFHPLTQWLSKPIIVVHDHVADPYIGIATHVDYDEEGDAQLRMLNYLTRTEKLVDKGIYPYSDLLLRAICDSDPRTIIALLYNRVGVLELDIDNLLQHCLTYEQITNVLDSNGFNLARKIRREDGN